MKFEVYDETKKPEPVVGFKLSDYGGEGKVVVLQAVDENGVRLPRGDILSIRVADGKVYRYQGVYVPGIKTDRDGRIQEKNNVDN